MAALYRCKYPHVVLTSTRSTPRTSRSSSSARYDVHPLKAEHVRHDDVAPKVATLRESRYACTVAAPRTACLRNERRHRKRLIIRRCREAPRWARAYAACRTAAQRRCYAAIATRVDTREHKFEAVGRCAKRRGDCLLCIVRRELAVVRRCRRAKEVEHAEPLHWCGTRRRGEVGTSPVQRAEDAVDVARL